jgi:hypothetical protein
MTILRIALGILLFGCWPLHAADLSAIERKIAREPQYSGKPKYCLLVFGPEAKTRVWLALDGDKLYVDRNANGDLTDDGEALQAKIDGEGDLASRSFTVAELREGGRHHKQLAIGVSSLRPSVDRDAQAKTLLQNDPTARGFSISADIDYPGRTGNGLDGRVLQMASRGADGILQFASNPKDAPVVHFGGPWSITFYSTGNLVIGRDNEFILSLGTPGVGTGSTVFTAYETLVPGNANPTAEIEFESRNPGAGPVKELFELKLRC